MQDIVRYVPSNWSTSRTSAVSNWELHIYKIHHSIFIIIARREDKETFNVSRVSNNQHKMSSISQTNKQKKNKQTNKQPNKQTNKQTNKLWISCERGTTIQLLHETHGHGTWYWEKMYKPTFAKHSLYKQDRSYAVHSKTRHQSNY